MSTQHHLSGGTYREKLRESGFPAWRGEGNGEMSPPGGSETTEPSYSPRGAEALTRERNSCQALPWENNPCPRQLSAGAGSGMVGRAVGDTVVVPLRHWEEERAVSFPGCVGFQRRSATPLVLSDGPVWDCGQVSAAVGLGMR